jgi:hypothetical protein
LTYTATDASGNAATAVTRTVTVGDATAPVITLVGAASISHQQGTAYTDAGASASDAVDGSVSVTTSGTVDVATAGIYRLTFSATDAAGNAATAVTRTVTVADNAAPVITLIGAVSVSHEQGTAYTDAGASASDVVDGAVAVTTTGTLNTAVAGTYTLTLTATDSAGNSAVSYRTVVVADTTRPVITLIGDASVSVNVGGSYNDAGASAADTVDGVITSSITTVNPVNTSAAGAFTVTYNVSDAAGNSATEVTRTVTVTAAALTGFILPKLIKILETE